MNLYLKKSLATFSLTQKIDLYISLLLLKLGFTLSSKRLNRLSKCTELVKLMEDGVDIKSYNKKLFFLTFKFNSRKLNIYLRKNGSDLKVFKSVFLRQEYKLSVINISGKNISTIVDAGGNIGLTTLYYFCYFPNAKYFIIEPDVSNFEILKKNISINQINNSVLLNNALWTTNEKLVIKNDFRDGEKWSTTVDVPFVQGVNQKLLMINGISLLTLCKQHQINKIDILKIDIEGAERFLFLDNIFLKIIENNVHEVIIEIHDEFGLRPTIYSEMERIHFQRKEDQYITFFYKK
jgi:FkbM family methyltransferase